VPQGYQLIRTTTKPSKAKCDLNTYTLFLLAESKYPGCTRLAEILEGLSHDSVNRFLLREQYDPKDLFDEIKLNINLIGGTLSGKDRLSHLTIDLFLRHNPRFCVCVFLYSITARFRTAP